jgi:hypothetical protein
MTDLTREQRSTLRTTIDAARREAEAAAADALRRLGVADVEPPSRLDAEKRKQRNRLRAHARALGDARAPNGNQAIVRLIEQAAYAQWHRLLFARFLLERKLLREETGATLSLNDCREIAFGEGAGADEWSVAAGFTATMLPGVFPADDPVESLVLAPEHARTLRKRLLSLDADIFHADDSLGWTYQFWRAAERKAINEAQLKIGARELPAVTQLFTEPYMVRFLLHNTLGAWWAGKRLAVDPLQAREAPNEATLRAACALPGYTWDYLRFVQEEGVWRPAAGSFPGWPTAAKALTVLDPCCGSGHFVVEALAALTALRRVEENLSPAEAAAAVLRDNLAGLEIDERCVQIAAFNLALAGWRIGGAGTMLPTPNVSWAGAPPPLPKAEFLALANGEAELRHGLEALHDLFRQAPMLGSLIEPLGGDLADPRRLARIEVSIVALVERVREADPERAEGVLAARGMADATAILARRWTLQVTNVPFLGRGQQDDALKTYLAKTFDSAKADLATAMLQRMRLLMAPNGTLAVVTPQNWLFLGTYRTLRRELLGEIELIGNIDLGPAAFREMNWWAIQTSLTIWTNRSPRANSRFFAINADTGRDFDGKPDRLRTAQVLLLSQNKQLQNPDARIGVTEVSGLPALSQYADVFVGFQNGDTPRWIQQFWEHPLPFTRWELFQATPIQAGDYEGLDAVILWDNGQGELSRSETARVQGREAWGKRGVLCRQTRPFPTSNYIGTLYDQSASVLIPKDETHLSALRTFAESEEFVASMRSIANAVKFTNSTFVTIPFDIARWKQMAAEKYPNGLPDPYSDHPTQWLFHGDPRHAAPGTALHVALARIAGYRWPAETDTAMHLSSEARARVAEVANLPPADADGLLPLSPLLGERGLADRLRAWCAAAWGTAWKPDTEAALVAAACERAKEKPPKSLTLEAWLRTHAARQHAKLFYDRPFLWWITDGRADGFCVVTHYHRLTRDVLSRLAFHVLGDYLARLGDDPRAEAARILQRTLEQIIDGEAPYDIFVRWKSLNEQPLGWDPDLDDGVRLNIRPFVEAGVLAHEPNVKYGVDRGKDVPSAPWHDVFNGERRNDYHTTLAEKRRARGGQAMSAS